MDVCGREMGREGQGEFPSVFIHTVDVTLSLWGSKRLAKAGMYSVGNVRVYRSFLVVFFFVCFTVFG